MANPKSKRDNNLTLVGKLNLEEGLITETVKDVGEINYSFFDYLKEFDGKEVSFSIKEKQDLPPLT
ncbi:YonK family protein [Oceanobacillus kimchii]|uniref:Bacillus phage SPbeta YonK domain-containing protein n=1 Tax=Oceanobacillus kimchii TaxID=746691 RepID=A0ABQ5TJ25_9BACI|nr:YonK family protein [Oceanobacillus kimchii]GLO66152.1 hypothetical protein MACH08_19360 [Oceanobacillus kimchii]